MSTRISSALHIDGDKIRCSGCDHVIGAAGDPWKPGAALTERPFRGAAGKPYSSGENVVLRQFTCPGCGALLDSETALPGDPFLNDILFE